MKIKFLVLFIISVTIFANSCKEQDCNGEPEAIYFYEEIYIKILDKQGEDVFNEEFSIDSLIILENNQELAYEYSDNQIKFQLSNDFYTNVGRSIGKEIIENIYFQYDYNTVDTLTIKTIPKFYPDECDRSAYYNTRVFYNSKLVIENMDAIVLFNTNHRAPLIITRE